MIAAAKKEVQKQIDEKIMTVKEFSIQIEEMVKNLNTTYMDAIIYFADKNNVEVESVAALVKNSHVLKAKLAAEGEELKMLKSSGTKLPI
jgi:hypothetical protein